MKPLDSPLNFNLNKVGGVYTADLFRIWANEESANRDDFFTSDISFDFTFTSPAGSGQVTGLTSAGTIYIKSWGEVIWGGPTEIAFDNGRVATVTLSNARFNHGPLGEFWPGYRSGA